MSTMERDVASSALDALESMDPLVEMLVGLRSKLVNQGFSMEAAEEMTVLFARRCFAGPSDDDD